MRLTEQVQGLRLMKFEEIYERSSRRELSQYEAASISVYRSGRSGAGGIGSRRKGRKGFMTAGWAGLRAGGFRWIR